jgi:hypothetical protein
MTGSPPPIRGRIDRDRMARVAAGAARSVPGVLRLQPDLKHLVGRAARDLFSGLGTAGDAEVSDIKKAEPAGIDIDRGPDGTDLTLRIVTGTVPAPHLVAIDVRRVVTDALTAAELTARVLVVVVDVET